MTQDTFKAWRKAYQAGKRYAKTQAWAEGDGVSLAAYVKAKYADENARQMFVSGAYAQEKADFYRANPDYTGNGWSGFDSQECDC